jgi:thiosulfate dehydrogenase [quinone] large subunit
MLKNMKNISFSKKVASLRILFGIVWTIDALFKFEPAFWRGQSLLIFTMAKDAGEPSWLNPWFHAWYRIFGVNPMFFAIIIIIIEALIALSLLFGVARRFNYLLAIPFCFLIWSVGEAFGGPYVSGSTDINAGFIYVLVFIGLYLADGLVKPSWSLDPIIEKHFPWWSKISGSSKNTKLSVAKS